MWQSFIKENSKPRTSFGVGFTLHHVLQLARGKNKKKISDYKQEEIIKHGSQQFKELAKKGLGIKVALL